MYADDLLTANTCEAGLQQQFQSIEQVSEVDGLRISYKKTLVAVFGNHGRETQKWDLHGKRGKIVESAEPFVKYLGFVAEAEGGIPCQASCSSWGCLSTNVFRTSLYVLCYAAGGVCGQGSQHCAFWG